MGNCCDCGFVTGGPNEALVKSGCCWDDPQIIVGGRTFVCMCVQKIQRLSLSTMTLSIKSENVYTKLGVPVCMNGIAQPGSILSICPLVESEQTWLTTTPGVEQCEEVDSSDKDAATLEDVQALLPLSAVTEDARSLLMVALLRHLCSLYVSDPEQSHRLYRMLWQELMMMGMASPLVGMDEMTSLFSHLTTSFHSIVKGAIAKLRLSEKTPLALVAEPNLSWNARIFLQPNFTQASFKLSDLIRIHTSRYQDEFSEISALGKGAYGCVFKVKNKLDGNEYAIKKITFEDGRPESWYKTLREVKNLASLAHKNVVGYHGAWLEYSWPNKRSLRFPHSDRSNSSIPALTYHETSSKDESGESSWGIDFQSSSRGVHFSHGISQNDFSFRSSSALSRQHSWHHSQDKTSSFSPVTHSRVLLHVQMALCTSNLKEWLVQRNNAMPSASQMDLYDGVKEIETDGILKQILQGVGYIHSMQLIHRDIKPQNIFLQSGSKSRVCVKIGDFGLARDFNANQPESPLTPHPGAPSFDLASGLMTSGVGTTIYAAPEQLSGGAYDSKSDMYSLGLVTSELYHPMKTESERITTLFKLRENGLLCDAFNSKWPKKADVICKLLSCDPSERPSALCLLEGDLFHSKDKTIANLHAQILQLRDELANKDKEIAALKKLIPKCAKDPSS